MFQSFSEPEFKGDIYPGDLINLKPEMMLVDPRGPVMVVDADNDAGIYGVTYTAFRYDIACGRMDIDGIFSRAKV